MPITAFPAFTAPPVPPAGASSETWHVYINAMRLQDERLRHNALEQQWDIEAARHDDVKAEWQAAAARHTDSMAEWGKIATRHREKITAMDNLADANSVAGDAQKSAAEAYAKPVPASPPHAEYVALMDRHGAAYNAMATAISSASAENGPLLALAAALANAPSVPGAAPAVRALLDVALPIYAAARVNDGSPNADAVVGEARGLVRAAGQNP
jgi:hypothetical protein